MRLAALCFFTALFLSAASIDGTVLHALTNQPLAGARVRYSPNVNSDWIYTKTDAQGHFEFSNVTTGFISVELPGFIAFDERYPNAVSQFGVAFRGSAPKLPGVELAFSTDADGTPRATATVKLTPASAIVGRVTDPNGVPLANAAVEARLVSPGNIPNSRHTDRTDDRGEFRFGRLHSGSYYVATVNPWSGWPASYRETYYPHALDTKSARPVELKPGAEMRVDIQVISQAGVRVSGRIVHPTPADSRGFARMILVPKSSELMNPDVHSMSATGDTFEWSDILPGKYTLEASTVTAADANRPVAGISREIEVGDADVTGLVLEFQKLPEISGVVTFAEGCAQYPLMVTAYGGSRLGGPPSTVQPDSQGRFSSPPVQPGKASIRVERWSADFGSPPPRFSVQIDGRDITKGFDYPAEITGPVSIIVSCYDPVTRRPQ